jgi:hypothetical protein
MLKVICASRIVVKPELICINLNKSIREIPVTISAFIMGMLVMPMMKERILAENANIAIHAKVPIIVAKIVDRTAMDNVLNSASATASSSSRLRYQLRVKPPHFALDLLELKERTIRVMMGAYINISIRER